MFRDASQGTGRSHVFRRDPAQIVPPEAGSQARPAGANRVSSSFLCVPSCSFRVPAREALAGQDPGVPPSDDDMMEIEDPRQQIKPVNMSKSDPQS